MKTKIKNLGVIGIALGIGLVMGSMAYTSPRPQTEVMKETKNAVGKATSSANLDYGKLPLYFIQNDGQVDEKVKFYEKGSGHATYFTKDGVYLTLHRNMPSKSIDREANIGTSGQKPETQSLKSTVVKLSIIDGNKNPKIIGESLQEGKVNYYIGKDPKKWVTNLPTYKSIVYQEIYPGIDMKFYGNNRQLVYDLVVKPGADPSRVRFAYEGIEDLSITDRGDLEIGLKEGNLLQKKPFIYQEINGKRIEIKGKFSVKDSKLTLAQLPNTPAFNFGFEVASYDKNHPLIIDPTLVYSTYLGGSGEEAHDLEDPGSVAKMSLGLGISVDGSGNAWVVGSTDSTDFPTAGAPLGANAFPTFDIFVTKLNSTGTGIIFSTYLGGDGDDDGHSIVLNLSGDAHISGETTSTDFPTMGAFDSSLGGGIDAFALKISSTGSLLYSTYLGGTGFDTGHGIALNSSGDMYIIGTTDNGSGSFPITVGPGFAGGVDAFVARFDPTISGAGSLIWSRLHGGSSFENGLAIKVDAADEVYISGVTGSSDYPLTGSAFDSTCGTDGSCNSINDSYVAKLDSSGSMLLYSTFLGGEDADILTALDIDGAGNVYLAGNTFSTLFPTSTGAYDDTYNGGRDQVVVKMDPSASGAASLVYSTFLGGALGDENGHNIAVDLSGNVYVNGRTTSSDFPTTPDAYQAALNGPSDAYLIRLKPDPSGVAPDASDLLYSTYIGGSGNDNGHGVFVDTLGSIYMSIRTASSNFPITPGAYDDTYNGGAYDAVVVKLSLDLAKLVNISTRGLVGTGDEVMIGGFFIGGPNQMTVLIRAQGPSLPVSGVLSNPTMKLFSGATVIAENDDWETTVPLCLSPAISCGDDLDISGTGLDPCSAGPTGCTLESAMLVTLPPGGYTAIVSGVGGGTGVGLVEIFEVF